jgi:hypothetical protein
MARTKKRIHNSGKGKSNLPVIKLSLVFLLVYIGFLVITPLILEQIIPCLGYKPFVSYKDAECTMDLVLNNYVILALSVFSLLTVGFWVVLRRLYCKCIPVVFIVSLCMSLSLIAGFLLYIPYAEKAVRAAPIILDTMKR